MTHRFACTFLCLGFLVDSIKNVDLELLGRFLGFQSLDFLLGIISQS